MGHLKDEVTISDMKLNEPQTFNIEKDYLKYIANAEALKPKGKDLVSVVSLMKQLTELTDKECAINMFYSINNSSRKKERFPSYIMAIPSIGYYDGTNEPALTGNECPNSTELPDRPYVLPLMIPLVNLHTHPENTSVPSDTDLDKIAAKSFHNYKSIHNQEYLMKGSPIEIIVSTSQYPKKENEIMAYRFIGDPVEQILDNSSELSKIKRSYHFCNTFDERLELIKNSSIFKIGQFKYKDAIEIRKELPKLIEQFAPFKITIEKK